MKKYNKITIKFYRFTNKLSEIYSWAKKTHLVEYSIIILAVLYFLTAYNSLYMSWYDENVIPITDRFVSNIWVFSLTFILIAIAICDILSKCILRYHYDKRMILVLLFLCGILITCRLSENYEYVYWIWCVSYVDVIIILCVAYIIAAIVNYYRVYCKSNNRQVEDNNRQDEDDSTIDDSAKENIEEDIFDFKEEVERITDEIEKLNIKKIWSIAITAPWGKGKTSFMNFVKEKIKNKKNKFEVIEFNPRDCKSYKTIQEEFLTTIACVLSKYDSRFSNTFKDYMASLQLIDNRGIIKKLWNLYSIGDKASHKETINKAIASLDKKVIVMIDDFDRLSKEEILEVLKLIDSNAAFENMVFLTAFDKEQVNKSLGDSYKTKDACFVDKFFDSEHSIPQRPYLYISKYIEEKLCEKLKAKEDEKNAFHETITKSESKFEEYLPTLRDAKRYINQFVHDFKPVRGEVMINEYLLVQLIKYRYPDLYKELYKKTYVKSGVLYPDNTVMDVEIAVPDIKAFWLKEDLEKDSDKKIEILPVLKILFPTPGENRPTENTFRHIYDVQSFDNYFTNQIYNALRIRDMEVLFPLKWDEVTSKIDEWATNDYQSNDFIRYLYTFDTNDFSNGYYFRYAEMVAYLACKLPDTRVYLRFTHIIDRQKIDGYDQKYRFNFTDYKNRLLEIIKDTDPQLRLITKMHYLYKTLNLEEDNELIKDDDIWPTIRDKFIQTANDTPANENEEEILGWLYSCIDHKEATTRRLILDKDCLNAYRNRLGKSPSYYLGKFVRLGITSSNPDCNTIDCDHYWKQIFEKEDLFEDFLNQCKDKNIENIERVWNFWQIYKENDYNPIKFENQGNVQEKIDNNLVYEYHQLEELKRIKKELSSIPEKIDSVSEEDKTKYREKIRQCKEEIDKNTLYILLNGRLKRQTDEMLRKFSDK